jgi:hypothetical protein
MLTAMSYGFAGVAIFVVTLAVIIHVWPKRTPGIPFLLRLWIVVAVVIVAATVLLEPSNTLALIASNLAVYLFIVEAFIFIYGVAVASLSMRLIVGLLENASDTHAFELTFAHYSANYFLDHRLERLVEQGLLTSDGDRYRITDKGRSWARVSLLLKDTLAVGPGG